MGDRVTGICPDHEIPNPATGVPQPAGPLPFSALLTAGLVPTVEIAGKPAAVVGSSGFNTPPHVGLHPADPFMLPAAQIGRIVSGSETVFIGGKPAATTGPGGMLCATPGDVVGSAETVLVG
jgi:uncharacterized Zn-binding protein involved in type VI secretion